MLSNSAKTKNISQTPVHKKPLGMRGEDIACAFLIDKSYTIIARNKRMGKGELDIVCVHEQTLVFVEVKSAVSSAYFHPHEHFTHKKSLQLRVLARMFLMQSGFANASARIDLITVNFDGNTHQLEHFQNVA